MRFDCINNLLSAAVVTGALRLDLCLQLLSLCPSDDSALSRQLTCLLMSAAACLQVARTTHDDTERVGDTLGKSGI